MSYILNALRKSEQERQQSQPETLENRIELNSAMPAKKTARWIIVLVIINVFFLGYFIWSFSQKDNAIVDTQEIETIAVAPTEIKINKPQLKPLASIKAVITPQPSIAEQIKKNKAAVQTQAVSKQAPKPKKQKQAAVETAALVEKINLLKEINKVESISPPASRQTEDIPFLSALDYEFRRSVPAIDINVYVYAEKKQDRFIMIDMKKYLAGEQISSGLTLIEIGIDSLVVEYRNRIFQIKRK